MILSPPHIRSNYENNNSIATTYYSNFSNVPLNLLPHFDIISKKLEQHS